MIVLLTIKFSARGKEYSYLLQNPKRIKFDMDTPIWAQTRMGFQKIFSLGKEEVDSLPDRVTSVALIEERNRISFFPISPKGREEISSWGKGKKFERLKFSDYWTPEEEIQKGVHLKFPGNSEVRFEPHEGKEYVEWVDGNIAQLTSEMLEIIDKVNKSAQENIDREVYNLEKKQDAVNLWRRLKHLYLNSK